ncbi:hypothetical protein G6F52_013923 [Rhizopus delemar]|nr:hypothetical protein G6F52_013923 [Rhizopus delemar]
MHADNARGLCIWCRHRSGHALQRVLDFVQAGGHGGRQQRGGTKAQMGSPAAADRQRRCGRPPAAGARANRNGHGRAANPVG